MSAHAAERLCFKPTRVQEVARARPSVRVGTGAPLCEFTALRATVRFLRGDREVPLEKEPRDEHNSSGEERKDGKSDAFARR